MQASALPFGIDGLSPNGRPGLQWPQSAESSPGSLGYSHTRSTSFAGVSRSARPQDASDPTPLQDAVEEWEFGLQVRATRTEAKRFFSP